MYKSIFIKRDVFRFKRFSQKGYSLFAVLGREVVVGVLSVAMLTYTHAGNHLLANELQPAAGYEQESDDDGTITLSEVEVTATRAPLTSGQAVRMVTVLTREDIQAAPVQSVNDLLKYAAGVDVRQRGPIGAQTDVSIRGGTQEQITVLLNGINIGDPQTGHNAFDFPVDISDIVRIEVLEGPAGRAYGTSSLLGAINIVTSRGYGSTEVRGDENSDRPTTYNLRLEGGSFGYLSAAGRISLSPSALSSSLSASYTRSDGYNRSKAGNLNADYSGGKVFYQGGWSDEHLRLNWHAGLSTKGYGSNTFYSAKFDEQFERTTKLYTALQGETRGTWFHFQPSLYWNRSHDRFELIRGSEENVKYNYHRTDVFGLNLNSWFDWALGRTALGAEFRNEDIISGNLGEPLQTPKHIHGTDRDYTQGLNRTNLSLHLEHNILLDRLNISAGFIAVKNSQSEMPIKLYPGIDASLQLARNLKLYASYNTSLRMPSFTELYYSVGGHKADKHLKPEELSSIEAGLKLNAPAITASASIFYNHCKNMIDWSLDVNDHTQTWQSVNHTKVNTIGVEAGTTLDLPRLIRGQQVLRRLTLSYCYMNQDKKLEENLQSQYSLEYLRHKLVARLLLSPIRNVDLSLCYRFQDRTGSYTSVEGAVEDYRPYSLFDARLSWQQPRFEVYGEVNNLFNKRDYVDYGNVPQPGTWFIIGTKASF
ncbi:MAG: TonB-dependent receptor [Prevotella sp.]|nr:TonB-dependent receptor [Prevotella sp.]